MARIRTIKPCFFRHERLFDAEEAHGLPLRLAFAGLWTAADRQGRFVWKPRQLKQDCLPHDDLDFSRVLDALAARGFIVKYQVEGKYYGFIPSYRHPFLNEWHDYVSFKEKSTKVNHANYPSPAPVLPQSCPSPTEKPVQREMEEGDGEGEERGKVKTDIPVVAGAPPAVLVGNLFLQFWEAYPKRDGANPKEPAPKKFMAILKAGEDADAIVSAVKTYASHLRARGYEGTQYVAQAITWLDESRWQDYTPRPEDAERQMETDQMMAAKGLVWAGGRWQKTEAFTFRHDPQHDDPYLETDIGQCPECDGKGCQDHDEPEPA